MTYYKQTLTFTNSPADDIAIYIDGKLAKTDTQALERAMRIQALKWLGSKAVGAATARMRLIKNLTERIGEIRI